jgi:class 3 adenylate cyclase
MTYTAIGHTVGLAQRMEQLAEPGTTYLTANTARVVQGYVEHGPRAQSAPRTGP